jgi:hypothetical protein
MKNVCLLIDSENIAVTWCGKRVDYRNEGPLPLSVEDALHMCQELDPEEFTVCVECADAVKRMLS